MEFEKRIYRLQLKGTKVTVIDFSNVTIEEHLKLANTVDGILRSNNSMTYFLMNGYNAQFNLEVIKAWKNIVTKYDFVEYRASVYGLDFLRRIAVKFTNYTNPHSVSGFKKKEDAEMYLIENII